MTPDELVAEIFRLQEQAHPDRDPGDLLISVQDDMPLVTVSQDVYGEPHEGETAAMFFARSSPTPGGSIAEALANHLERTREQLGAKSEQDNP